MNRYLFPLLTAALIASWAGSAIAGPLPAPFGSTGCSNNGTGDEAQQFLSGSSASCSVPGASATLSTFPYIVLQTLAPFAPAGPQNDSLASLSFSFEVVGPYSAGTQIPLFVTTELLTNATVSGAGLVDFTVSSSLAVHQIEACTRPEEPCPTGDTADFDGTFAINALIDTPVTVSITAQAGAGGDNGGSGGALADPLFQIDQTFLDAHPGLTFEFPDGVGNGLPPVSSVPEPSSFALLAAGLAALAGLRRRAYRVVTADARA